MQNRIKVKLVVLFYAIQSVCSNVFAQAYYMHEAAEDGGGNPIGGIVGLLVFIGIGVILDYLFKPNKKHDDDDDLNDILYGNRYDADEDVVSRHEYDSPFRGGSVSIPDVVSKKREENVSSSFKETVIQIYGNQTERFGGILIIKEDGEYHFLFSDSSDDRYKILDDYILSYRPNHCTDKTMVVDWELIRFYLAFHKEELPTFNSIDEAKIEENDFRGGKVIALRSYYEKLPCYRCHPVDSLEFFASIGMDETILLHKIIGCPMDLRSYRELKIMQIKNIRSYEDYEKYRRSVGQWSDDEKEGYSFEEACEDIKKIKWDL